MPVEISTIKDIAKKARVGISTVSRVINRHPDVSPETQEKVLRVVKQLRFRPHSRARQLVRDKTETICFVMSNRDVMSPFHSHVLIGVEQYARSLSHNLIFMRFDYPANLPEAKLTLPPVIWERGAVDGLILAGTNYPNFVRSVRRLGIPFVLFSNNLIGRLGMHDIDTVNFDNESGARRATEYLLELGHRDILFVGGLKLPWYKRCHQGYLTAMEAAGLAGQVLDATQFEAAGSNSTALDFGVRSAELVLKLQNRPTAIVAGDDEIALGLLSALQRNGMRVPEDMSLIGFDDIDATRYVHPSLTTILVPKEEVGRQLGELLFERLDNPNLDTGRRVVPTELVIRESCAARSAR